MMYTMVPYRTRRAAARPMMNDLLGDRFFRSFFDMGDMVGAAGFRVDVREQEDAYILEAELPGVRPEDVTLTAEDDVLTIAADVNTEKKTSQEGYLYSERRTGHMERRFHLEGVRQEDITAACVHGVLTVTLPKARPEAARSARRIAITGASEPTEIQAN